MVENVPTTTRSSLANRKSKRLASPLRRQSSVFKAKVRLFFVEPLIFLSATSPNCKLSGTGPFKHLPARSTGQRIRHRHHRGVAQRHRQRPRMTSRPHPIIRPVLQGDGRRPESGRQNKHRKVGDYQPGALPSEGASYQDWEGTHTAMDAGAGAFASTPSPLPPLPMPANRWIRCGAASSRSEGIDHPGIVKVKDYQDTELGPALIFDHDPKAIRLDFLLREMGQPLNVDQRLQIVRDPAETLEIRPPSAWYHRALPTAYWFRTLPAPRRDRAS